MDNVTEFEIAEMLGEPIEEFPVKNKKQATRRKRNFAKGKARRKMRDAIYARGRGGYDHEKECIDAIRNTSNFPMTEHCAKKETSESYLSKNKPLSEEHRSAVKRKDFLCENLGVWKRLEASEYRLLEHLRGEDDISIESVA